MKRILSGVAAAALACTAGAATAATISVDLDALTSTAANPVVLELGAGTWTVTPVIGGFTAWNAWGSTSGCALDGTGCSRGWLHTWALASPSLPQTLFGTVAARFSTPELAFSAAVSTQFTLAAPESVSFFISDSVYRDNLGGVSLRIAPLEAVAAVPLPAGLPLLLGGLALLGVAARRSPR
jgi:hypothetical protein